MRSLLQGKWLLLTMSVLISLSYSQSYGSECQRMNLIYEDFFTVKDGIKNSVIRYFKDSFQRWTAKEIQIANPKILWKSSILDSTAMVVSNHADDPLTLHIKNEKKQATISIILWYTNSTKYVNGTFHGKTDQSIFDFSWNGKTTTVQYKAKTDKFAEYKIKTTLIKGGNVLTLAKHQFVPKSEIGALIIQLKIHYLKCKSEKESSNKGKNNQNQNAGIKLSKCYGFHAICRTRIWWFLMPFFCPCPYQNK